jgi:hypothetical protein
LLAQRKVTQRNGLKGSRRREVKSRNVDGFLEIVGRHRFYVPAIPQRAETLRPKKQCSAKLNQLRALSPQCFGALRYSGIAWAWPANDQGMASNLQACNPHHAMSFSGHFFGLLFFGPAKKSDSGPLGSESAAGNAPLDRVVSFRHSLACFITAKAEQ